MVDELTKVSKAGRDIRVVQISIVGLRLSLDHQTAQRQKIGIFGSERRKVAEHSSETSFIESRARNVFKTA